MSTATELKKWQDIADESIKDAGYWKKEARKAEKVNSELLRVLNIISMGNTDIDDCIQLAKSAISKSND